MNATICPYCNSQAVLVDSASVYNGKSYGPIWKCPECPDAYTGCHRGTSDPLGTLANAELRAARIEAHAQFDPLWRKHRFRSRGAAYAWLAKRLGIARKRCHIGIFGMEECRRTINICREIGR